MKKYLSKLLDVCECSRIIGECSENIIGFLKLRGYIMLNKSAMPNTFMATALGIERGYVANYLMKNNNKLSVQFALTSKGVEKVGNAFASISTFNKDSGKNVD